MNDSIIAKEEKDPWDLLTMQEQYVFIEKANICLTTIIFKTHILQSNWVESYT